jgi:hypothetical protein
MVTLEKKSGATARFPRRVAEAAAVAVVVVRGEPVLQAQQVQRQHRQHQHRHQPQQAKPPRRLLQEHAVAPVAAPLHLEALRIGLEMQLIRRAFW